VVTMREHRQERQHGCSVPHVDPCTTDQSGYIRGVASGGVGASPTRSAGDVLLNPRDDRGDHRIITK